MDDWISVSSSYIHSYRYEGGTLFVRFKDKKSGGYRFQAMYEDVPLELWIGLLTAPSKGSYFHSSGLQRWPYTPL